MKGQSKMIFGIIGVIVIALAVISLTGIVNWGSPGAIVTDDGCTLVKPEFGRIECEPLNTGTLKNVEKTLSYGQDYGGRALYRVECGDNENSPVCDFYARCDCNPSDPSCYFYYQSSSEGCNIGSDTWCKQGMTGGQESTFLLNKPLGTTIQIGSCKGALGTLYAGEVGTYYTPYGLNVYEFGGKFRYSTTSCSLSEWGFSDQGNVVTDCGDADGCSQEKQDDYLDFGDWVNYLSSWNYVVEGADSRVVEYNGQTAYCIAGNIWELGDFETENACYKVQKRIIASKDCCPGMRAGNQVCGDDFTWHSESSGQTECFTDLQCAGQGTFITDYSTTDIDIVRWGCISGKCEVVERKTVQCTLPNIGCSDGQVCDPDTFTCQSQVGPGIECGDGVCSSPYEDIYSCPQDCTNPDEWDLSFLWIILLLAIGAGLGYLGFKWVGAIIGGAAGGIIGLLIYWFLGLDWWQQMLLGIGGIAGAGIGIYVFGGAIVTIIIAVVVAWRKQ